jgi:hypothetical protein
MNLFNSLTDALYIRIILFLASGFLAILSILSPALYMEAIQKIAEKTK